MTDEPENLVLRYLRRLDAKIDAVAETQREHAGRLTRIEVALAGLRREQASDAETSAISSARTDRLSARVDGIERRLDLADQPEPGAPE